MEMHAIKRLLEPAIRGNTRQTWAELGSGEGRFTLALRELCGSEVEIYSVDNNLTALARQKEAFEKFYPDYYGSGKLHILDADFNNLRGIPPLDGILMANSLHYVRNPMPFLQHLRTFLKPEGKLVIVEYFTYAQSFLDPFPLPFKRFADIAQEAGYHAPTLLDTAVSTYNGRVYSAITEMATADNPTIPSLRPTGY